MIDMEQCKHVHRGEFTTTRIGEVEVRIERCKECGIEVVNPEDAHAYLTASKESKVSLDAKNLILALLGSYPERPMFNRTLLMKEAFLFKKEVAKDIGIYVKGANFAPYNYGPHSKEIADKLDEMEKKGILKIERESEGQKQIIHLTDRGKEEAKVVMSHLDDAQIRKLKSKRKGWDQLGYNGILEKVYEEYPAYRVRSRIANEVGPKRRWDEEHK